MYNYSFKVHRTSLTVENEIKALKLLPVPVSNIVKDNPAEFVQSRVYILLLWAGYVRPDRAHTSTRSATAEWKKPSGVTRWRQKPLLLSSTQRGNTTPLESEWLLDLSFSSGHSENNGSPTDQKKKKFRPSGNTILWVSFLFLLIFVVIILQK